MRKKIVKITNTGAKIVPKFFPILHSKRKNVIAYPELNPMNHVPMQFWTKDENTGKLREMTRPEKLKRLQYFANNGDQDGLNGWIWLVMFSGIIGLGYAVWAYGGFNG